MIALLNEQKQLRRELSGLKQDSARAGLEEALVSPLPVAGLMSDRSSEFVREKLARLAAAAKMLGSKLSDPFMAMAFLTLPPIPEIRITDRGVIDAVKFKVVDLFCDKPNGK